ncbi:hypothetical protein E2542_SST09734 [Spatholobus suberectus]|nr:hypothetical protein E2542_SST09734 [Spatholobus suberectus]
MGKGYRECSSFSFRRNLKEEQLGGCILWFGMQLKDGYGMGVLRRSTERTGGGEKEAVRMGHIKAAVQSSKEELEDERRLRQLSENLHRKLARESFEVKSSFLCELSSAQDRIIFWASLSN